MFTIDQIHDAFNKVKGGKDFPQFVKDLREMGIQYYENFVSDGHTSYVGDNSHVVEGNPKYPSIPISDNWSAEQIKQAIYVHQLGQTDYLTFCREVAQAGVDKWITDTIEMTVTYFDKKSEKFIVEPILNS